MEYEEWGCNRLYSSCSNVVAGSDFHVYSIVFSVENIHNNTDEFPIIKLFVTSGTQLWKLFFRKHSGQTITKFKFNKKRLAYIIINIFIIHIFRACQKKKLFSGHSNFFFL